MKTMWGIRCNFPEYGSDQLVGWLWFSQYNVPMSKNRVVGPALFASRELAREHLDDVKNTYKNATVVKIVLYEEKSRG